MILAGIQIAITQPIKLDDVVVVEGEWGHVEEITLTYVVLKLWDERRLILPITYFLEKPFQNWTRTSTELLGTVVFLVDYNFPVEEIRKFLPNIVDKNPNWDGRVANVEITNNTELYKELRILVSSSDSSKKWNLCTEIREKVIDFINKNYPDSFMKYKLEVKELTLSPGQAGAKSAK
jgi:small-conductance mechanosensitive channel